MKFTYLALVLLLLSTAYAVNVSLCQKIDTPGEYVVNESLSGVSPYVPPPFDVDVCIWINVSNVDFDCNGSTMTGPDDYIAVVIYSQSEQLSNVTIRNCDISDYDYASHSYNSTVTYINNNVSSVISGGFYSEYSNSTYIDNRVNDAVGYGFYSDTSEVTYLDNSVNDTGITGFYLLASNSTFTGNNASYCGNHGFYTYGYTSTFFNNTAKNNAEYGFYLQNSTTTAINNTAHDNDNSGFRSEDSISLFSYNDAYSNDIGFITVYSNSTFINNTAFNNINGFDSRYSNSTFINNTAFNNSNFGFNPSGFYSIGSNDSFTNNFAYDNSGYGFRLVDSNSIYLLTDNFANGSEYGFVITNSNATFTNNNANNNDYGFFISTSSNATLTDCVAYANNINGMRIYNPFYTTITNSWFYYNNLSFGATTSGATWPLEIINSKFGYSSVNISINDDFNSSYYINETTSPGSPPTGYSSFRNKYIALYDLDLGNSVLDLLQFHWSDSETNGYNESSMTLFAWNGTSWILVPDQSLDTASNTLNVTNFTSINDPNVLGLFANTTSSGGNNNGGQSDPELSIEFETDCFNHTIIVTSGNDPVENAKVVVNGDTIGYTDENGEIEFEGCTDSVIIRATKSGYDSALYKEDLDCDCSQGGQEPECTTDQNCAYNQECTDNVCEDIDCSCGTIQDHECVSYECCSDSECSTGYSCVSNNCEQTPEDECSTDADCAETQYCSNGSCLDVTGTCGYVANHAFVAYECGTDANCPTCPNGLCINNECVANDLTCEDGLVGSTANCAATEDNAPCANCEYEVTTPDGQTLTGTTDENGNFNLPLNLVGTYTVSLIKGGVEVSSTEVTSSQTTVVDDDNPPVVGSDPMQFIFLAVILLLIAAIVIYWYSTRGKSKYK
ncbi:MAG: right-handed parallel beta-helix repeat-containing protein [Candidatus Micrarchaeota archaeon]